MTQSPQDLQSWILPLAQCHSLSKFDQPCIQGNSHYDLMAMEVQLAFALIRVMELKCTVTIRFQKLVWRLNWHKLHFRFGSWQYTKSVICKEKKQHDLTKI